MRKEIYHSDIKVELICGNCTYCNKDEDDGKLHCNIDSPKVFKLCISVQKHDSDSILRDIKEDKLFTSRPIVKFRDRRCREFEQIKYDEGGVGKDGESKTEE